VPAAGGGVGFLSEDRQVFDVTLVITDKLFTLNKHATAAAAAVIDAAIERLDHFYQQFDNAGRGVKLSAFFPSASANWPKKYS